MTKRKSRISLLAIGVLLILWSIGFAQFVSGIPHQRAPANATADAVVVFTGLENMRDRQGLETFREGRAGRLLISGVSPAVTKKRLLAWLYRHPPGDLKLDFTLGYQATNTVGNAEETASWACENDVHSILLTTADYHMPRALFLLRHAWPDAKIIPDPLVAPYGHRKHALVFDLWGVWQSLLEYHKLTIQRARYWLGDLSVPERVCAPSKDDEQ